MIWTIDLTVFVLLTSLTASVFLLFWYWIGGILERIGYQNLRYHVLRFVLILFLVPVLPCLFETASAVGTVGVTLGITQQIGLISRMILVVLMFLGRVGGLTLIFAAVSGNRIVHSELPAENITVG